MPEHDTTNIYTVTDLTKAIKSMLEDRFPFIWVTGEISNYAVPGSGHSYFSLKDDRAVIQCVMFKGQKRRLKFEPENGLKIRGLGRLSLYEPRGVYQLIFEHLEPEGLGSLQKAFEQLKQKLSREGLFDGVHKKPLPFLPAKISVVTSPTGAAVRDILQISLRRFPHCHIEVVPVKVQGNGAENEVVHAIEIVNNQAESDLILLARGGGSIEDLAAFNTETVARAIFASTVPVLTGIGHETDFTIADFAADVRAPTPSGAAELAVPKADELAARILELRRRITAAFTHKTQALHLRVDDFQVRLKNPAQTVAEYRERVSELHMRMKILFNREISQKSQKLSWTGQHLQTLSPDPGPSRTHLNALRQGLKAGMQGRLDRDLGKVREMAAFLSAVSPASVLERGYSITRTLPGRKVVTDSRQVESGHPLEIILPHGRLETRVEKTEHAEENI